MKKLIPLLLLILAFSALVPMVAAQTTASPGCQELSNTSLSVTSGITLEFAEGELIEFTVSGPGAFTIVVAGNTIMTDGLDGATASHTVAAPGGNITIIISNPNATLNSQIAVVCTPADQVQDFPPGMICHRPPGNPENAHTINVGSENAVQTHIEKHGDTEGPCPEGVDTKLELPDIALVIFVEPLNGVVSVYDCELAETEGCETIVIIPLVELIDFSQIVDGEGNFIEVDEPIQLGEIAPEGFSIVLHYLHPYLLEDIPVGVFQISIYFDGELVDGNNLLFINAEGNIVIWTTHAYWDFDEDEGEA